MPDITIIMPAYNKEKYICDALDSIFEQKTSYIYQVIVADDCSTDRTVEIVKQYQSKYPDKIQLLTSDRNQKLYKNVLRAYEITKTDYFCVLDPDDMWINNKHIQNAIDFLEKHKDYTIYSTHILKKYSGEKEEIARISSKKCSSDFKDGLNLTAKINSTQSSVYRNVIFKNGIPNKMLNLESKTCEKSFRGDTFRNYIHLHDGKAYYEPKIDAVYNITDEGIWTTLSQFEQNILNAVIFKDLWLYFDKKYIELLVISRQSYNKSITVKDKSIKNETLENIAELEQYYKDFEEKIEDYYLKKSKIKIRLRYFIYKKLHNYLTRKGIVS